jgi:hypothetical protein
VLGSRDGIAGTEKASLVVGGGVRTSSAVESDVGVVVVAAMRVFRQVWKTMSSLYEESKVLDR